MSGARRRRNTSVVDFGSPAPRRAIVTSLWLNSTGGDEDGRGWQFKIRSGMDAEVRLLGIIDDEDDPVG